MFQLLNRPVGMAGAFLSFAVIAGSGGSRADAHSCQLFLMTNKGWGLVTVNGAVVSPEVQYFGGDISYGVTGGTLAVVGIVGGSGPARLRLTRWDIRTEKVLTRKDSATLQFEPPPPKEGVLDGLALTRRSAYFQAWQFKRGDPASLVVSKNWLVQFDLKTGFVHRAALIPFPRSGTSLLAATTVPHGVALFFPNRAAGSIGWLYTAPSRKLVALRGVARGGGGFVMVKHYGLLAYCSGGILQRLTQPNMSQRKFRAMHLPRGIVGAHAVRGDGPPQLACLAFTGYNPNKSNSTPTAATLFMYDLHRHRVLWRKRFRFPESVINASFASSPDGNVFAFINSRQRSVLFYNRHNRRVTSVKLPKGFGGYALPWAHVIAVK